MRVNPRRVLPVILVGLLMAGTVSATVVSLRYERDAARERARTEADRAAALMTIGMTGARESLDDVAGLFDASDEVTATDFAHLGRRILGHSRLGSLAWAPRVPGPSGPRYPIAYYTSPGGERGPIGLDQGTVVVTRAALEAAVDQGSAVMTPPVPLAEGARPALLVYQPVYRGRGTPALVSERRGRLTGVVVGTFDMDALTSRAAAVIAPGLPHVVRDGDAVISASPGAAPTEGARASILVLGRTWTLLVGEPPMSWGPTLIILLAGAGVTLLALAITIILSRRDRFAREAVRRATEDLHASRRSQRALVENSPDIVARYDAGLRCLYANAAIERATGHPPGAFIGRTLHEAGHPDEMVSVLARAIAAVAASGEEQDVDFDASGPHGARAMHARLAPEFADDGTVESVLVLSREVTAQRSAEAAMRASEERYRTLVSASCSRPRAA